MDLELLVTPGCPQAAPAVALLLQALSDIGLAEAGPTICVRIVGTEEQARRRGFAGSPTVLIDGQDPFPRTGRSALACRLYPGVDGPRGVPELGELRRALKQAAHRNIQLTGSP